ncbi:MAG: NAD(P)H-binding protein [Pseudomonadota bacterium]
MRASDQETKLVAVVGANGTIGRVCIQTLLSHGHAVRPISRRSKPVGTVAQGPVALDMRSATLEDWRAALAGVDAVVNCAGVLQDGAQDNLEAVHVSAVRQLLDAIPKPHCRMVQISAAGVSDEASTAFFRTKAEGDALIRDRASDWVILRPTLVLGPDAYGGTALLRASAATPWIGVHVLPYAPVQTVYVGDVAAAVLACVNDEIPSGTIADLTASEGHSLSDLTTRFRQWLGLTPWRRTFRLPDSGISVISRIADGLGWLGCRSPLRSTAVSVLRDGVRGDQDVWASVGGAPCRSLDETLATLSATAQERLFARMFLLLPVAIATLSVFWTL